MSASDSAHMPNCGSRSWHAAAGAALIAVAHPVHHDAFAAEVCRRVGSW